MDQETVNIREAMERESGINAPSPVMDSMPEEKASEDWPRIRIKKIRIQNFCRYKDVEIDFTHNGDIVPLSCFVGPNGTGKTTILDAVSMLCSHFQGYDNKRLRAMMLRRVRNYMNMETDAQLDNANFLVEATFEADRGVGEYQVAFSRNNLISRHPDFIQQRLPDYCVLTRFDEELGIFQVKRDRWPLFKELFEAVTGYPVEEEQSLFDDSIDRKMSKLTDEFVLGFRVDKGRESITHKQCSSGEKKIAKCFSTILNKPVIPSIILIDNSVMHVEIGRHISVIDSLEKCFKDSQLIVTCHSVPIMRSLPRRERLIDMRFIDHPPVFLAEPWRMRMIDDIREANERLSNAIPSESNDRESMLKKGALLMSILEGRANLKNPEDDLLQFCLNFLAKVPLVLKDDILSSPKSRIMPILE
jgi:ABC-type cobalamin/Fe3+-siderophores transport system ATPase subunit